MDHVLGYRLDGRCTATLPTPTGQGAVLDLTPAHIQSGHGAGAMVHPRKALGQHFLSDRNILAAIADAAGVGPADVVVEVGPGTGSLTEVLAARARRVVAVELDAALAGELAGRMPANAEIHTADARQVDVEALLGGCISYKLLGNLPYYAAMPILRRFLESRCRPQEAVVLLQREVAQQVCATPGRMSLTSLVVQLYGTPRIVRWVRPGGLSPAAQGHLGGGAHPGSRQLGRGRGRRRGLLPRGAGRLQRASQTASQRPSAGPGRGFERSGGATWPRLT